MTTQEIVSKLWNLCNVLRDDGITYHQYVTELTYILFLKMAKETGTEEQIPEKYRWDELKAKSGVELKKFYKELLSELGDNGTGRIREIYQGAATNIDEPKNLEKIIASINAMGMIVNPILSFSKKCNRFIACHKICSIFTYKQKSFIENVFINFSNLA